MRLAARTMLLLLIAAAGCGGSSTAPSSNNNKPGNADYAVLLQPGDHGVEVGDRIDLAVRHGRDRGRAAAHTDEHHKHQHRQQLLRSSGDDGSRGLEDYVDMEHVRWRRLRWPGVWLA